VKPYVVSSSVNVQFLSVPTPHWMGQNMLISGGFSKKVASTEIKVKCVSFSTNE
jgi:hypothetical protein